MRWLAALLVVVAACGDAATPEAATATTATAETPTTTASTSTTAVVTEVGEGCADVVGATAKQAGDGTWTFSVTVASADTGDDKFADAWEVRSLDGSVLGTRILAHPHVNEQPFTRTLSGVELPEGTTEVVIAARDSVAGFCGETVELTLDA